MLFGFIISFQKKEIDKLHELKSAGYKTALSGDGRFDSPGKNTTKHFQ